jgi:hypothetical protein
MKLLDTKRWMISANFEPGDAWIGLFVEGVHIPTLPYLGIIRHWSFRLCLLPCFPVRIERRSPVRVTP